MADIVRRWVPNAYEAFEDYSLAGVHLSRAGLKVVQRMMDGEDVTPEDSGMSKREWQELMESLGRDA